MTETFTAATAQWWLNALDTGQWTEPVRHFPTPVIRILCETVIAQAREIERLQKEAHE